MNPENMRQQVLHNPQLLAQLKQTLPELAQAAQQDPQVFSRMVHELERKRHEAEETRLQNIAQLFVVDNGGRTHWLLIQWTWTPRKRSNKLSNKKTSWQTWKQP
jgi:hypothetical protein